MVYWSTDAVFHLQLRVKVGTLPRHLQFFSVSCFFHSDIPTLFFSKEFVVRMMIKPSTIQKGVWCLTFHSEVPFSIDFSLVLCFAKDLSTAAILCDIRIIQKTSIKLINSCSANVLIHFCTLIRVQVYSLAIST